MFKDIPPATFLKRNDEAQDEVTTLAGISKKFQYVVEVKYFRLILTIITTIMLS